MDKTTMKCVVKTAPGPGNLELWEKPIPVPGAGEVLIQVRLAAICGTDVHIKEWAPFAEARVTPPTTIGHEFCGDIIAVGEGVDPARIGQRVSGESHVACHSCAMCLDGKENLCLQTRGIGVHFDGCFAEYVTIPAEVAYPVDPNVSDENNAILEPLGTAVLAATKVAAAGKTVAITGCGPIGLMSAAIFKKMGAKKVICVELNEYRAEAAKKMGADIVLNPKNVPDMVTVMKEICDGLGPDIVIECSGNGTVIKQATEFVRAGGEIVPVALPNKDVSFNFTETFYRGVNMYGISGREMFHTWKVMTGMLSGGLDVSGCISHVLPLENFAEAFELLESGKALKVLLRP